MKTKRYQMKIEAIKQCFFQIDSKTFTIDTLQCMKHLFLFLFLFLL